MVFDKKVFIALCRQQIEKKYAFGNGNGYTQMDLELLAQKIEEKRVPSSVFLRLSASGKAILNRVLK